MQAKNRTFIPRLVLGLALVVLITAVGRALVNYAILAEAALTFPYPLDYGEGPLLDQTMRILAGENIYDPDFSTPPYTISNYPPLFLLAQVPFAAVFGPAMWYGRLISLLGALVTAVLIGLTLQTLSGDRIGAVVGGLLFVSVPFVQYWSLLNRIDLLALVLSWGALFVTVRFSERKWSVYAVAALLIAAIYTRQSYALAAPMAAFVWLLFQKQYRKALALAAWTGGVSLVLFLLMMLITRGGFFLNIVTANVNPFKWETVRWNAEQIYQNAYPLVWITGVFLVIGCFGNMRRTWALVLPYVIGAVASAVTIGKDGSNVNYLLELGAALCLASGAAISVLGATAWMPRRRFSQALLLLVLAFQVWLLGNWAQDDFNNRVLPRVEKRAEVDELFRAVQEADGIVLADEYMGLLPMAGKRIYFQPFEYKMLKDGRIWDDSGFMAELREKRFSLILWYQPPYWPAIDSRWTPGAANTIRRNYSGGSGVMYDYTRLLRPR